MMARMHLSVGLRLILAGAIALSARLAWAQVPKEAPPAPGEPRPLPAIPVQEVARLRIVNEANGEIAVSRDGGRTWCVIGHVIRYTCQVDPKGYTASKWVPGGHVAATAVNAMHITVGYNAADDRGIVFSLLPQELLEGPTTSASFLSPEASIYTDIPGGHGIFGGGEAPFVTNPVLRETALGPVPLPATYVPAEGDVLLIPIEKPVRYPSAAVFENREGGAVTLEYPDGSSLVVGTVVRPVLGIGRFLGGVYAGIGRIRASHAGVIDVSVSPVGALGGFQIIPYGHSLSPEMGNAWKLTQWMVVQPLAEGPEQWGSMHALFYGYLRPDYRADDLGAADWENRLLARSLVDADLGDGWRPMPAKVLSPDPETPLPDWAGRALEGVRRIRLLFPLAERRDNG